MLGVLLVDHIEFPLATDDDVIRTPLFDGSFDFHNSWLMKLPAADNYLYRYTILALLKSYGVSSNATLSPGRMRM